MRIYIYVVVACLFGVVLGVSAASLRTAIWPWLGAPSAVGLVATGVGPSAPGARAPRSVVENDIYNFGRRQNIKPGRHKFVIRNEGSADLELAEGETSCHCTEFSIESKKVPPGGSTVVNIEWDGTEFSGVFQQTATILTNDPLKPQLTLTIRGIYTVPARVSPAELTIQGVAAGKSGTAKARLFGYVETPMEIVDFQCSDPEHFDVELTPIAQADWDEEATAGWVARITVKPGLPLGPFRETIFFNTNLDEIPTLELPIGGLIGDKLVIAGPGWNRDVGILLLGNVRAREGIQRNLIVRINGAQPEELNWKVIETKPDWLKVDISEPQLMFNKAGSTMTLGVTIPKNSPKTSLLGPEPGRLGRIILRTGEGDAPELHILIQCAVTD